MRPASKAAPTTQTSTDLDPPVLARSLSVSNAGTAGGINRPLSAGFPSGPQRLSVSLELEERLSRAADSSTGEPPIIIISSAELSLLNSLLAPGEQILLACRVQILLPRRSESQQPQPTEYFALTSSQKAPGEACVLLLGPQTNSDGSIGGSQLAVQVCMPVQQDFLASVGKLTRVTTFINAINCETPAAQFNHRNPKISLLK